MNRQPKIAVIISSTRDARFGARAADWLMGFACQRSDMDFELVDLKTFDLPLFNEKASNLWAPSEDPRAIAWQQKIAEFDGYVVVTAEYNHSLTGALKNAFDQAYVEWKHKPIGFFGYGGVGAARAIEHARLIAVELHMVPVRTATHIAGGDFFSVVMKGEPMESIAGHIEGSTTEMLDQVVWWAKATMAARA